MLTVGTESLVFVNRPDREVIRVAELKLGQRACHGQGESGRLTDLKRKQINRLNVMFVIKSSKGLLISFYLLPVKV